MQNQNSTLFDELFSQNNVDCAMIHILEKKNTVDSTGLELYKLPEFWQINREFYREMISNQCYLCETVHLFHTEKKNGNMRTLANIPHIDMLLARMLYQVLAPRINRLMADSCYAFISGRSIPQMIEKNIGWLENGKIYCAHLDIASFFDTIPFHPLQKRIEETVDEPEIRAMIKSFLYAERAYDGQEPVIPREGLLQGSPLSPILSNLYLLQFDKLWQKQAYVRYSDDIFCFFDDINKAQEWFGHAENALRASFGLKINKEKSGILPAEEQEILGYYLRKHYNHWKAETWKEQRNSYHSDWKKESMRYPDKSLWLLTDGGLSSKDGSIEFEAETKSKTIFPAEEIDTIHIMSRMTLSSPFFQYANQRKIRICFFDRYGNYIGDFVPESFCSGAETTLAQARICNDEKKRLSLAVVIIQAAFHNMVYVLRQNNAKKDDPVSEMEEIRKCEERANQVDSIASLMLVEAHARLAYYEAFNKLIQRKGFSFWKRTRRPPMDPLNAMISIGNIFLYNRIATEIHKARLDINLSVLHKPEEGRTSLALDLSEIFKPLIVDRAIFSLINRKEIDADAHFDRREDRAVLLNREGKKLFIAELNKRLSTCINYNNRKRTWMAVIQDEIYRFKKAALNDEPYKAYRHR